jgi:nucleotide-binding universal stress UspA family protein
LATNLLSSELREKKEMPSLRQILFPVDFSEQTLALAPHVACMATQYRANVMMLHVIEIPASTAPGWPEYSGLIDYPALIEDRKQRLHSFLRTELENVSTARLTLEGDPGRVIAEYAEKEKVDLIMMPTHGYGPFRRFLLGSVTAKVLHDAHCPIWTSAHLSEPSRPHTGHHNVLCAVDLTSKSLPLLQWAAQFARERRATLKLVHAIPAAKQPVGLDLEGDRFRASLFEMAGVALANLQSEAGTSLETLVAGDEVANVIRQAAEENRADLVIIGRGVIQEAFGRMRTHVYSIVRETPCPVISV